MHDVVEVVDRAVRTKSHVWVVTTVFVVDPPLGGQIDLGEANMLGQPAVTCYRCEEPYSERLKLRACKGPSPLTSMRRGIR